MRLPDAEVDVLAVLWNHGPSTVRQIRDRVKKRRSLSHASVSTLLRRLEQKGLVEHEKAQQGKAFVFKATKAAVTRSKVLKEFTDRVFDGCGIELVSCLLRSSRPDAEELDRLPLQLLEFFVQLLVFFEHANDVMFRQFDQFDPGRGIHVAMAVDRPFSVR